MCLASKLKELPPKVERMLQQNVLAILSKVQDLVEGDKIDYMVVKTPWVCQNAGQSLHINVAHFQGCVMWEGGI